MAAQTYFGMIIMIEFPNIYYASMNEPKVKEILQPQNAPEIKWRNKYTTLSGRNHTGKFLRFVYKFYRGLFCCVIYYIAPMGVVLYGHIRLYLAQDYIDMFGPAFIKDLVCAGSTFPTLS